MSGGIQLGSILVRSIQRNLGNSASSYTRDRRSADTGNGGRLRKRLLVNLDGKVHLVTSFVEVTNSLQGRARCLYCPLQSFIA